MNEQMYPPEWLLDRVSDELRRGICLLTENQTLGLVVDSIRLRLFLDNKWQEAMFDSTGRIVQTSLPDKRRQSDV
jgi:hypothetical protein